MASTIVNLIVALLMLAAIVIPVHEYTYTTYETPVLYFSIGIGDESMLFNSDGSTTVTREESLFVWFGREAGLLDVQGS